MTTTGYVTSAHAVDEQRVDGDTASTRQVIDASCGCEHLEQRVIRFGLGRSRERENGRRQEVLYMAGRGTLEVDGERYELERETGVYIAPGERYAVDNPGPDDLVVVSVTAPEERPPQLERHRRVVRWRDQPSLPASPNREFRYLVNQDVGCPDITQFVGVIPPGKAGMHSHTYDEVVYVVEGEGVLHLAGRSTPIAAGSCIHLPPLVEHCLENTGDKAMRVLGVFHPSGDPASRAGSDRAQ